MEINRWKSFYEQIVLDMELDAEMDKQAAEYLSMLTENMTLAPPERLEEIIRGKRVRIFGSGPSLADDLRNNDFEGDVLISADGVTTAMMEAEKRPHIIVTDLDGEVEDQIKANEEGAVVVIHGHGDNMDALKEWVPKFEGELLCTTQTDPVERVHNFGGFTDGDRGAYIADHFGADSISLVAFNFAEPMKKRRHKREEEEEAEPEEEEDEETKRKLRKLTWANVLIGMLEHPKITFFDLE